MMSSFGTKGPHARRLVEKEFGEYLLKEKVLAKECAVGPQRSNKWFR
jgi:hypothetical protein